MSKLPRPTASELTILHVLWEQGPATVRQVHEALADQAADRATRLQRQWAAGEDERAMAQLTGLGVQWVHPDQIDLADSLPSGFFGELLLIHPAGRRRAFFGGIF